MGRRTLVLIVALLLAGVAAFAVYRFLTGVQNERMAETDLQQVYRTQARIEAGTSGDLVIQQFDDRLEVSDEVVELTPELAVDTEPLAAGEVGLDEALSGKVAAGPIPEGVVVTTDMWIDPVQAAQSLDQVIGAEQPGGDRARRGQQSRCWVHPPRRHCQCPGDAQGRGHSHHRGCPRS